MDITKLANMGRLAKTAAARLALTDTESKNKILAAMADAIEDNAEYLIEQNNIDLSNAKASGMSPSLLDRLMLKPQRIKGISDGIREIIDLPDPIGDVLDTVIRPNGIEIRKTRVPLGVIAIIYESRPNVTADAAALCIKSGNAVILRGGKEAVCSNKAIASVMHKAAVSAGMHEGGLALIDDTTRQSTNALMRLNEYVDVIIPRGGAGLIRAVVENATVPYIETGTGNCHIFVDKDADLIMANNIVINAKTSRPGVCNAAEKLLVHEAIAESFLPNILTALTTLGVEVRGDDTVRQLYRDALPTDDTDWATEYLDLIIAVKIVSSVDEAIEHINKYSSNHSESIITKDINTARRFQAAVDSAAVYHNASTRFTDGGEFGLGAEIGISTQKMHARGPMGLSALTSVKYVISGTGQVR